MVTVLLHCSTLGYKKLSFAVLKFVSKVIPPLKDTCSHIKNSQSTVTLVSSRPMGDFCCSWAWVNSALPTMFCTKSISTVVQWTPNSKHTQRRDRDTNNNGRQTTLPKSPPNVVLIGVVNRDGISVVFSRYLISDILAQPISDIWYFAFADIQYPIF